MDAAFYDFDIREGGEVVEYGQIPDDYEGETQDNYCSPGRFRRCHGLIERQNPDTLKLVRILTEKLFDQSSSYTPSGQEIPEWFQMNCRCDIFNFTESLLRDERHMNRSKFLIVVTCKAIMRMDDDDEIEEEEEDDYYDDDMDVETLLVELVNEQKGFVGASKSAIEGLEKVSGMGSGECAVCLQGTEKEEEEAKRMPCGHVYHGDCILHWLEKSRLCPLCRFANLTT